MARDERIRRMRERQMGRTEQQPKEQAPANVTPMRGRQPGMTPGTAGQTPGMTGQMPGMIQGAQGAAARGTGRRRPVPMREGGGLPDGESAVRTAGAESAYRQGQRMGAENIMRESGVEPIRSAGTAAGQPITKEKILEANVRMLKFKAAKASVDRRIIHAQQWWKMRNWKEIEREKGVQGAQVRKSATAWLWNCIVGKHADAIDSYPEPIILPRAEDDKEEARRLTEIVPVVLQVNGFEEVYSQCQWQKMQEGTAGYGVFWDKTKLNGMGDIAIRKINILNLFWEPGVSDIEDSGELFYVTYVDNKQLEGMYPQLAGKLAGNTLSVQKYLTDDSIDLTDKSPVIDWYYHKWEGPKKVLHYCKYVGEEILYSTENNGETEGLYEDGEYPFVLDPLFPVEGSPCGYGYIDIGKDAQADIDTLNQAMVLNAAASATPRYFIRKDGAINEEEFADYSKPLVHTGGSLGQDSVLAIQSAVMPGTAINMLQQKIDELKFVTGNSDVNNGGTPAGVTAASAIAALKEDAGRSSKDSTKASYRAYAKIIRKVISRIRQGYDIPRQFRILGARGQEQFTSYSNEKIKPQPVPGGLGLEEGFRLPVFDIDVRAQRENAYTKMSQNELALQFYNSGMFNPQMSDQVLMCLDMMDFKGKDEIMQKVQQNGTMQETLMQISQIAMALAQKYQPEVSEQLAAIVQGVAGDQQIAMQMAGKGGGISPKNSAATRQTDPQKGGMEPNENGIVRRAREQAANASRPS